jgi:hypothetical protein
MAKFYEFHDSILEGIERVDSQMVLNLCAIRTEWDDLDRGIGGKVFRQQLTIVLQGAVVETDSPNLPDWLLDGEYRASRSTVVHPEDALEDMIPVSLTRAEDVHLRLAGMNQDTHEYVTVLIRAKLMKIEKSGEPEFIHFLS